MSLGEPSSDDDANKADNVGTAIVGSAGIAALLIAALLVGAVPFTLSLRGVGLLPYPGGLRDLSTSDLWLRAGGTFLIFAVAGIPADLAGKTVTIWRTLRSGQRNPPSVRVKSAKNAGKATSLAIKGAVLTMLLSAWLTESVTGAVAVALLTVTLEYLLEPVVDRYVIK